MTLGSSPVKVHQYFSGRYRLHLQNREISVGSAWRLILAGFFHVSLFHPEDGNDTLLRNVNEILPNYTTLKFRISYLQILVRQIFLSVDKRNTKFHSNLFGRPSFKGKMRIGTEGWKNMLLIYGHYIGGV